MKSYAPIVLFTYNRPNHTSKTLEALKDNFLAEVSELYIFSDAAKTCQDIEKVEQVRKIIKSTTGFKNIFIQEQKENQGLAKSVISGMNQIFEKHHSAIILEDDILTTKNFLAFMNQALAKYDNSKEVFSISGYLYPINIEDTLEEDLFFCNRSSSWGWATWKDRWETVDWEVKAYDHFRKNKEMQKSFDKAGNDLSFMLKEQMKGNINSWAIRFCFSAFLQNKIHAFPKTSLVENIGTDGSGTHSGNSFFFKSKIYEGSKTNFFFPEEIQLNGYADKLIYDKFYKNNLRRHFYSFYKRHIKSRLKIFKSL